MEGGATVMAEIIANAGSVLSGVLGWIPQVATALLEIDLIMFLIYLAVVGVTIFGVIKLIKRFTGKRKI